MSFKKFGGLNYSAKSNIISNHYSNSGNLGITDSLGQLNSKIVCLSHLDMSANSIMNIGSLYFMDGTIQTTALVIDPSGTAIFNNGIIVNKGNSTTAAIINGDLHVTGTSQLDKKVTIGTTTTSAELEVTGTTFLTGPVTIVGTCTATSFTSSSDYRIKEDVVTLNDKFNIDKLRPVTYTNKNTKKQDIGFIAHEIQEEFPYLVSGEKDGEQMQSINYIGLIGVLVKEIQELKKRVQILENK